MTWAHVSTASPVAGCVAPKGPWDLLSFCAYLLTAASFAVASALLVLLAPSARGSGIPAPRLRPHGARCAQEVKTILGGFVMKDVLSGRTLVVKVLGLMLSVSSGLALGKEGPTVHIACCWANATWLKWSTKPEHVVVEDQNDPNPAEFEGQVDAKSTPPRSAHGLAPATPRSSAS